MIDKFFSFCINYTIFNQFFLLSVANLYKSEKMSDKFFNNLDYVLLFYLNILLGSKIIKFFLSSSPYPQYYYHQRVLGAPTAYTVPGTEPPVPIPSIPVQVPLQAQLAPAPAVHNVQLVPCLCPVSQDIEYEKYEKAPQEYFVTSQHKTN